MSFSALQHSQKQCIGLRRFHIFSFHNWPAEAYFHLPSCVGPCNISFKPHCPMGFISLSPQSVLSGLCISLLSNYFFISLINPFTLSNLALNYISSLCFSTGGKTFNKELIASFALLHIFLYLANIPCTYMLHILCPTLIVYVYVVMFMHLADAFIQSNLQMRI